MSSAREEILNRIRSATGGNAKEQDADYLAIPRNYIRTGERPASERVRLFIERLRDYGVGVYTCTEPNISQTVAGVLQSRNKKYIVIPDGIPAAWLPAPFEFRTDNEVSYQELDQTEGVMTGCTVAIAITGTIILQHRATSGRRALTLIPDYHLCIIFADQLVETLSESIESIASVGIAPVTMISGPSATSDIEMVRVKGVHGPRVLDVIFVLPSSPSNGTIDTR